MDRVKLRYSQARHERGNMLLMVVMVALIVIFVLLAGLGLMLLFSSSNKAKNAADELALGAAKILNKDDRQARVNILVERSRELVFSSRRNYFDLSHRYKHLEPLSRQMVDESRLGAKAVEAERLAIERLTEEELSATLRDDAKLLAEKASLNLNWFKAATPRIIECEFGTIRDLDSNVQMPDGFEELKSFDLDSNLVNRTSRLYKGNINSALPSPDDDLQFKLSPMPAPVKRTIAGARLLSDDAFQSSTNVDMQTQKVSFAGKFPCAVRLKVTTQVTASGRGELSGNVANRSVALTNGGTPAPDEEP